MTRIISTDEELQALRDGTILLEPRANGFSYYEQPVYWVVDKRDGDAGVYAARNGNTFYGMAEMGFEVVYEPPAPEERSPDSWRYKFEQGTLTDPHTVVETYYSDLRSDVDDEMNADGFWFSRPKITDQTTGEVICEAWAKP